jgi:hypothetical protein
MNPVELPEKRIVPPPVDTAPRRECPAGCGGRQAQRATCGEGLIWLCQNLRCRRRDVVIEGDCPHKRA